MHLSFSEAVSLLKLAPCPYSVSQLQGSFNCYCMMLDDSIILFADRLPWYNGHLAAITIEKRSNLVQLMTNGYPEIAATICQQGLKLF
ncbi:hypothetical protein LOK49_LG07G00668 [Camellia lanceoleosa]|uniref:Uncharacterized protein n=1 Tax=Camellia lanceoleosa TaxID=1840588 RepID=A0ACC0GZI2_9ERIC|nr:hypothetical protein LOK49_LG07G00668 [Camellia lanceoleosa]